MVSFTILLLTHFFFFSIFPISHFPCSLIPTNGFFFPPLIFLFIPILLSSVLPPVPTNERHWWCNKKALQTRHQFMKALWKLEDFYAVTVGMLSFYIFQQLYFSECTHRCIVLISVRLFPYFFLACVWERDVCALCAFCVFWRVP